jgi:hypothetical protein
MGLKDKFKVDKKKLQQQQEEYKRSRDYKLGDFSTYFELSGGMQQFMWKAAKEGQRYALDIIPFLIEENFPDKMFRGNSPEVGQPWFCVDLHVHSGIGPNNEKVVCPKHSFKSGVAKGDRAGCPICDELAKRQEAVADDPERRKVIWKEMKPNRRNLYNVVVRDNGEEEEKGVQLFEVAYFYFQQNIEDTADEDDDGVSTYWDIEEGKQIRFKVTEQGEKQAPKFSGFSFKDRKYEIVEEDLEESVSPQRWIKYYSFDELYQLIHQNNGTSAVKEEDKEDDDEEEKPRRGRRGRQETKVDEDDEDDLPFSNAEVDQSSKKCEFGHDFGFDAGSFDECQDCPKEIYHACLKAKVVADDKKKDEEVPEDKPRRGRRGKK